MTIQLAALLKRNFRDALFSGNFQSNFSSKFLLVAGSERVDSKASLSKARKASKYQETKDLKKTFAYALQNGCSKKNGNAQEQYHNPALVAVICDFMATELYHGHLFLECSNFFSGKLFGKIALTTCKGCLFVQ